MATMHFPLGTPELTRGQKSTIIKAFLQRGDDCRVYPETTPDGWVYVELVEKSGDEEPRGDGHYLDEDGDYRFYGGGKITFEDL